MLKFVTRSPLDEPGFGLIGNGVQRAREQPSYLIRLNLNRIGWHDLLLHLWPQLSEILTNLAHSYPDPIRRQVLPGRTFNLHFENERLALHSDTLPSARRMARTRSNFSLLT